MEVDERGRIRLFVAVGSTWILGVGETWKEEDWSRQGYHQPSRANVHRHRVDTIASCLRGRRGPLG